ncbi:SDR family NAD(P)-dependent oxidoreductase [Streptomyces sp. AJS327]|uniref:SDR family NAD(P)-dependent oxidoreductase n=1 Tax=Streptomyces sp. AJS327 TaxID=2545265 RepID=UPI0015DF3871|nr:SDR family NAD(P)-dependent oxidoreductase [Streptomyces sp. AJS327]MBA0051669.1 SDR family NAD(P)-dependent oxidoreductase [Streptomyces sp. AJS327]
MTASQNVRFTGRRILITGAARGIGAALARRLHARGVRLALAGLEPEALSAVAAECDAPWRTLDVGDPAATTAVVNELADELGGLDAVVANAGIAKQLPLVGGDPEALERMLRVNVLGVYHTLRAAGPHISHPRGYALVVSSLAAAVHLPLLGAYSASKAAVEALGNTARIELRPSGARVGVAYFAELDTEMTSRGFGTRAAEMLTGGGSLSRLTPLSAGIDALERGIARRSRRVFAPWWVGAVLPARPVAQRVVDRMGQRNLEAALAVAREERVPFTTPQPQAVPRAAPRVVPPARAEERPRPPREPAPEPAQPPASEGGRPEQPERTETDER